MISKLARSHRPQHTNPAPLTLIDRGILRGAIGLAALSLVGFGFLYSAAGVGIGQALFPSAANGSILTQDGKVVGSELVAQPFSSAKYFQPRPSAANYNTMALAGSNQARTNVDMRNRLEEARTAIAQREGIEPTSVPNDLITQSGGGIDPHITPEGAAVQIARVAQSRGIASSVVDRLVAQHTESKQLGILGKPRVNVLKLNLALDTLEAGQSAPTNPSPSP